MKIVLDTNVVISALLWRGIPYELLPCYGRSRAGTGHADVDDVSSNKNRHLAEVYAPNP
ncbi:MAG: hypothetical protein ACREUT_06115 [Steroidobacteraceae bacterium]